MENQNLLSLQKYGKQNQLQKVLTEVKNQRQMNPYTKTLLINRGLKLYTPKLKKFKVGVSIALIIGCLITPFTNWLIVFIIGWCLK